MSTAEKPKLQILEPFKLRDLELKNRMVLAPMTRARCYPTEDPLDIANTNPNEVMATYYAQRSSCGLIISEATHISELGSGWLYAPHIRNQDNVKGWKLITEKVHEAGGLIYLQLWHLGRQAHSSFHPATNKIVSASNIPMVGKVKGLKGENLDPEVPVPLTLDEIKSTIQDYVTAAKLAKEAGFDGVEVHSANGYLLDQFLQSCSNVRTDAYGGSMENRYRILKEIIEGIIADGSYPANRIGVRLSPNGSFGGMGSEDNIENFTYVAKELNTFGLSYLHVMDGTGFGYHGKTRVMSMYDFRKVFDGPMICNVGLTKEIAEGMVRSGVVDLVCFGRPYIANPDLPERFANDWPLAEEAPYMDWWHTRDGDIKKGYIDYPTYSDEKKDE